MPRQQLGRYEIIDKLGQGAMGIVYKARDPLIDRTVAIKTLDLDLSSAEGEAFERRFFREAKSAGRLNHSNIVTIHDVGKSDAVAYIAMEFLQGHSLREILDSGVVLPPEKIVDIAAQVADGLAFAHQNGVVHRDIKPPNIMVLDSGLVKITDFGIALLPMGSHTQTGAVFGSPKYMAPEQVVGHPVDGRADIFSLGAVLYEMLTGFPPFFGGELNAVLHRVINEIPPAPSSRNPSIAPVFDYIVAKAMAKQPDDRYSSSQAMAADLRHFREPRLPSVVAHALKRRAIRRRKGEAPLGSAIAVAAAEGASSGSAGAAHSAAFGPRRNFVVYAGLATLLAVVASWAVLSNRAADRPLPGALPVDASAAAEVLAGVSPEPPPGPRSSVVESPAAGAPASASKPAPPATRPVPVVAKPMARLVFAVVPWGEIYVDGRRKGLTPPLTEIELTPGKHTIEIRNSTFHPYVRTVRLEAESRLKIRHRFQ